MKKSKLQEKFVDLRAKRFSFEQIANELNVCRQTSVNWFKDLEDKNANCRVIELDAAHQQYLMEKLSNLVDDYIKRPSVILHRQSQTLRQLRPSTARIFGSYTSSFPRTLLA